MITSFLLRFFDGAPGTSETMTFIVRVSVDEAGRVTGILERVQTRQKKRFEGTEAIGPLIARMLGGPRTSPGLPRSPQGGESSG